MLLIIFCVDSSQTVLENEIIIVVKEKSSISKFHSDCRTDRYCKRKTVINGVTIPKGAVIVVPISLLQHSPLYWDDPEKFDPDRYIFFKASINLMMTMFYIQ